MEPWKVKIYWEMFFESPKIGKSIFPSIIPSLYANSDDWYGEYNEGLGGVDLTPIEIQDLYKEFKKIEDRIVANKQLAKMTEQQLMAEMLSKKSLEANIFKMFWKMNRPLPKPKSLFGS